MNILAHQIKIKAINDDVIIIGMNFDEIRTTSGIILRSDNGKAHGVRPRWGKVYAIGPKQTDVQVGQWILIEHGRWTRGIKIDDGEGEKVIQKVDVKGIMAVSDQEPSFEDDYIPDSL